MEPDKFEGAVFSNTACMIAVATDEATGVSHVAATLPGGTFVLTAVSARVLGERLLEAANAADLMNQERKGEIN